MKICRQCKQEGEFWQGQSLCKPCAKTAHYTYMKAHPEKDAEYRRSEIARRRSQALTRLGGGGAAEKREIGTMGIYRKVLKDATGYQLLCANCNTLKLYENKEHLKRHESTSQTK